MLFIAAIIGFIASFVSSTFGGGAGLISVPGLYWLFFHTYGGNLPIMQMTLTTGAAIALPLGLTTTWRQFHYQNVDINIVKRFTPSVSLGAIASVFFIHHLNTHWLKYGFAILILLGAIWFYRYQASRERPWQYLAIVHQPLAFLIGMVSILIGASIFAVPFLMKLGLDIKKAVGTASVIVFIYSAIGAVGLVIISLPTAHLPSGNLGYLNLPVFFSAMLPAIVGSIVAVKFVHVANPTLLRKLFIVMMLVTSLSMLIHL